MDSATDHNACTFRDILESSGLRQHVDVPTHRSGHTLYLIIDRNSCDLPSELAMDCQENCLLKHFETFSDLPSDHYVVICSLELPSPAASKKTLQYCNFKRTDKQKWREDNESSPSTLIIFELCTRDILSWCTSNMLSCNPTKTEIVHSLSQKTV